MESLNKIAVFCGASMGVRPDYRLAAEALSAEMVKRNLDLVYGGGSVGLMGVIAGAVHSGGRNVLGVIPRTLQPKELSGDGVGDVIVVESMHERKLLMAKHADAFIAMPGGFGTLDELFEMITWGQLGIHAKPVGLLNVNGYFDPLLQWIDGAIEAGFVGEKHRGLVLIADDPAQLLDSITAYTPPSGLLQWMDFEQA